MNALVDHGELTLAELRADIPDLLDGWLVMATAFSEASIIEEELTVSEYADRFRVVSAQSGSPYPGPWRTDRVPYLREPMDCLHPDHPASQVTLKFSAQTGKSEVGINWFCFIVDRAPAPILTILPTLDEAIKYNRIKLQTSIDASPKIRHRVRAENSRDESASTTSFKRFAGGFDQITTATSSKGLQMISVCNLIMDEVSGFPADTDGRGSPVQQARSRLKAYGDRSKQLLLSTPGELGICVITEEHAAGDQREYYMPCPQCGAYQTWPFEKMRGPAGQSSRPHFVCEAAGCVVEQIDREGMLAAGRWVPTWVPEGHQPAPQVIAADEIDAWAIAPCTGIVRTRNPSYAFWAAWSPMEQWAAIWKRGEEAFGDPAKEKVFTQQDLGKAWEPKSDTPDWDRLLACRIPATRGTVPWPVAILYGFIDVQGSRFEWGVWGFGPGFQGWLIDRGVIAGDAGSDEAWSTIDAITSRKWPTVGGREMAVNQWGIDTGAYTQTLYDRVSRRATLVACKGDNKPRSAPFRLSRADLRDERGNIIAGRRLDLVLIGNFELKMTVYEGLRHLVAGPKPDGSWPQATLHLPDWCGEDELKQLTAEVLIDRRTEVRGNGKRASLVKAGDAREWRKRFGWANEGLDIAVGCRALAWGAGAGAIDIARWRELVAAAHGPLPAENGQGDLFAAPMLNVEPAKSAAVSAVNPAPELPRGAASTSARGFIPRRRGGWLNK